MKNFLVNLSLSCAAFILSLGAVELFFFLNAKYSWFTAEHFTVPSQFVKSEKIRPVPLQVIEMIEKKYHDFKILNRDLLYELDARKETSVRRVHPHSAEYVILNSPDSELPLQIEDQVSNPLYNREIYSARYGLTADRLRFQPNQQKLNLQARNLVLIGCSLTFGTGVNDDETMPYFLKEKMPAYNVYNLGIPSAGLTDIFDDLRQNQRLRDLNPLGGAVIYTFIYDHLERTLCSLDCFRPERSWILKKNDYGFDFEGKLQNYGPRAGSRPVQNLLNSILASSEFLKFTGYERPKIYGARDFAKYILMLKELKKHYRRYNLDFYIFFPEYEFKLQADFYTMLDDAHIRYFAYDYPQSAAINMRHKILGDGHYTRLGNDYMASLLQHALTETGY